MEAARKLMDRLEAELSQTSRWQETTEQIRRCALAGSDHLRTTPVECVATDDLSLLFREIDTAAFGGLVTAVLVQRQTPLLFRFGKRMTSSAGSTTRHGAEFPAQADRYEIAISPRMLFQTFQLAPSAVVCGRECHDMCEALQRVMEHEVLHLIEMLLWGTSSCKRPRFRRFANHLFGHLTSSHRLITPRQFAADVYAIQVGDSVEFDFDGRSYQGIVNRITRRATILVADQQGVRYSNGERYRKFYVPLSALRRPK